jgi:hypothetical protein
MLFRTMGRDSGLAGLRDYIATYRDSRDHPVLQDFLAVMRKHAPDTTAFGAIERQWFYQVVIPQYLVSDSKVEKSDTGWQVHAKVKNVGTGTMAVEVAAARGERFPHGKSSSKTEGYKDARTWVTLSAGEERAISIPCGFVPERLVVDPDVHVMQLERQKASVPLKTGGVGSGTHAPQPGVS